jgi:hypothetical protein
MDRGLASAEPSRLPRKASGSVGLWPVRARREPNTSRLRVLPPSPLAIRSTSTAITDPGSFAEVLPNLEAWRSDQDPCACEPLTL